jgi:alpha-beta hydrolase superfamily lysophospholipase
LGRLTIGCQNPPAGEQCEGFGEGGADDLLERLEAARSCRYLLERGVSAVLVDAPGQGQTRLFGGLHLDEHIIDAITAFLGVVVADPGCDGRVGLWGNSAGGWLTAHAAATPTWSATRYSSSRP